jgi:hypothetical protein
VALKAEFQYYFLGLTSSTKILIHGAVSHMDATLEPARRMISKLLEVDAGFFREYHYLNPLMVDSSDQVAL